MIKCMKYEIITKNQKEFVSLVDRVTYDTTKILNKTINLCWEWDNFESEYIKLHKAKPIKKEILNYNSISGYCDFKIRNEFSYIYRPNLSTSIQRAIKLWNKSKKDFKAGIATIPSFKNSSVDLHSRSIQLIKNENEYYIDVGLVSKECSKEINNGSSRYCVGIKACDNNQIQILERILLGEYKISSSFIKFKKNKWFLILAYEFDPVAYNLDKNNVMGIDMGIKYPVFIAFNNSLKRFKIKGGEIEAFRNKFESLKRSLQSYIKGDGKLRRGKVHRNKSTLPFRNKISNFKNLINHKYAKHVVKIAVRENCGIIQMEDLSGISKDNMFLKDWTYFDLQQKIIYKSEEVGIEVILVNPKYTSQRCHICGYIDKDNRITQSKFICIECGEKMEADYNASKNLSIINIDKIIKEYLKNNKK